MGIFDFLSGNKVQRCVSLYDHYKRKMDSREEPHMILSNVLIEMRYKQQRFDPMVQMKALVETTQFACLAYPDNAKALGYYVFAQTSPADYFRDPRNDLDFGALMTPVLNAQKNGNSDQLYAKHNPHLASQQTR